MGALPRSPAAVSVLALALIAVACCAAVAPVAHSAYGYPAPRHSKKVAAAAAAPEVSLEIIEGWLKEVGLSNLTHALKAAPANTSLKLLMMLENSSTPVAALAGAELISALKTVAGLNPRVTGKDVAGLIETFIRSLNGTAYAWVGKYLIRALDGGAPPSEAVSYVLTLTVTRCANASPKYLAELVVSAEAFARYAELGEYVIAAEVVRAVALNYSLVASVFMAEAIPPEAFWEAGNAAAPRVSPTVGGGAARAPSSLGGGGSVTLGDVVKAILVLRRLGPKAVAILGRVPLPELVTAVNKVPVSLISNLSVNQLVSLIRGASGYRGPPPAQPGGTLGSMGAEGRGTHATHPTVHGVPRRVSPYIIFNRRRYRSLRTPGPGLWGNSTLRVELPPTLTTVGRVEINVSRVAAVVKAVVPPGSPALKIEREALSKLARRVRVVVTEREAVVTAQAPVGAGLAAALGGAAVVALAAVVMGRRGSGGEEGAAFESLAAKVAGQAPPILREFWECVAYLAGRFRVSIGSAMTHREVVNAVLEAAGCKAASLAQPLMKLLRVYEGVRFAGARPTTRLARVVRRLVDEVRRRASRP